MKSIFVWLLLQMHFLVSVHSWWCMKQYEKKNSCASLSQCYRILNTKAWWSPRDPLILNLSQSAPQFYSY